MADWFSRERTITTVEYVIPVRPHWGADWNQVQQALNQAIRDCNRCNGLHESCEPPDNQIKFSAGDDEIVISFEKKETGS